MSLLIIPSCCLNAWKRMFTCLAPTFQPKLWELESRTWNDLKLREGKSYSVCLRWPAYIGTL